VPTPASSAPPGQQPRRRNRRLRRHRSARASLRRNLGAWVHGPRCQPAATSGTSLPQWEASVLRSTAARSSQRHQAGSSSAASPPGPDRREGSPCEPLRLHALEAGRLTHRGPAARRCPGRARAITFGELVTLEYGGLPVSAVSSAGVPQAIQAGAGLLQPPAGVSFPALRRRRLRRPDGAGEPRAGEASARPPGQCRSIEAAPSRPTRLPSAERQWLRDNGIDWDLPLPAIHRGCGDVDGPRARLVSARHACRGRQLPFGHGWGSGPARPVGSPGHLPAVPPGAREMHLRGGVVVLRPPGLPEPAPPRTATQRCRRQTLSRYMSTVRRRFAGRALRTGRAGPSYVVVFLGPKGGRRRPGRVTGLPGLPSQPRASLPARDHRPPAVRAD
jgi:hypothetical protein